MIEDAIRYQTQGDDWVKRTLIGGGIATLGLLFSFLLLPLVALFTVNGYMLEVMRRVLRGETTNPPEWGELDLAKVTINGLRHAVVALGYGLVVVIPVMLIGFLLFGLGAAAESGGLAFLGLLVSGGIYFVGALALQAVIPVATANFVVEDRIGAGFDMGVLRDVVPNRTMLKAVVLAFVVNIAMSGVTSILGFTIIGYLLVPFVFFVGQSSIFYLWAEGFGDAYEEEYGERPTVPDGPVEAGVDVTPDESDDSESTGFGGGTTGSGATSDASVGSDATTPSDLEGASDDERRWE